MGLRKIFIFIVAKHIDRVYSASKISSLIMIILDLPKLKFLKKFPLIKKRSISIWVILAWANKMSSSLTLEILNSWTMSKSFREKLVWMKKGVEEHMSLIPPSPLLYKYSTEKGSLSLTFLISKTTHASRRFLSIFFQSAIFMVRKSSSSWPWCRRIWS